MTSYLRRRYSSDPVINVIPSYDITPIERITPIPSTDLVRHFDETNRSDLAREYISDIIRLEERKMELAERAMKLSVMESIASGHSNQICSWLNNRAVGERRTKTITRLVDGRGGFFFRSGAEIRVESEMIIYKDD